MRSGCNPLNWQGFGRVVSHLVTHRLRIWLAGRLVQYVIYATE